MRKCIKSILIEKAWADVGEIQLFNVFQKHALTTGDHKVTVSRVATTNTGTVSQAFCSKLSLFQFSRSKHYMSDCM